MPPTKVLFYKDANGRVPVVEWMDALRQRDPAAFRACLRAVDVLAQLGHELRRPDADYLRGGIRELRVRCRRVNYRVLYFFHGRNVAVVADGLIKEGKVPDAAIERALGRMRATARDFVAHTQMEGPSE